MNGRVHYVDDQRRFGRADVWSAANDTLRSGRGDCEDYAIAKFQLLRAAGFAERDLYLVIVRDLVRRADHAVLVARAAGHMYVLDNGTDDVLESGQVSDYRPVLTFASYGEWTHGYRMDRSADQRRACRRSALAQRVASRLERGLEQVGQNALAPGDDLRVGHHARSDRQRVP